MNEDKTTPLIYRPTEEEHAKFEQEMRARHKGARTVKMLWLHAYLPLSGICQQDGCWEMGFLYDKCRCSGRYGLFYYPQENGERKTINPIWLAMLMDLRSPLTGYDHDPDQYR